jgi:hypothetical protein
MLLSLEPEIALRMGRAEIKGIGHWELLVEGVRNKGVNFEGEIEFAFIGLTKKDNQRANVGTKYCMSPNQACKKLRRRKEKMK